METKELKIQVPEGYEIDKEKSTFENIVFKKKEEKRWRDDETKMIKGYFIDTDSKIIETGYTLMNRKANYNLFAMEKQAKSALAMARISQIMTNDERFGGPITDIEWKVLSTIKYVIIKECNRVIPSCFSQHWEFLAFHTREQRDLFLQENEDLVKDYLMID